jgi:hypothetical protein
MPSTTKSPKALVAEAERMASSGSSPSRGASLKASTPTRRRSKEKIRGRAQGAAYRVLGRGNGRSCRKMSDSSVLWSTVPTMSTWSESGRPRRSGVVITIRVGRNARDGKLLGPGRFELGSRLISRRLRIRSRRHRSRPCVEVGAVRDLDRKGCSCGCTGETLGIQASDSRHWDSCIPRLARSSASLTAQESTKPPGSPEVLLEGGGEVESRAELNRAA